MRDQPTTILVIEDDPQVLEAIISILEYAGYQSRGVTRFSESVFEWLQAEQVSLVILDVMLSGADGRELARRFKNTKEAKSIPILMISAYPEIESSVMQAGADDFLQKPFGLDELLQKVEQYVTVKA